MNKKMNIPEDYVAINKKTWNEKTAIHFSSKFYDNDNFLKGHSSLNSIELDLLGDLKGKTILHLQCHFGQDSISLARLGAKVTGVDFSDKAIERARYLAQETKSDATFICCNIYDLPAYLDQEFDLVFTSYGTIGWLPDIDKWAEIVSRYLKPNGEFVFVEFHPVVWMFDANFEKVKYNYFNSEAIIETESGTYADKKAEITQEVVTWNHSLSEVMQSLIKHGLVINDFNEYDYSPYDCFSHTTEFEPNKFRITHLQNHIPMVYSILAKRTKFKNGLLFTHHSTHTQKSEELQL
jgi:ubiquinone/menaquinone biosynthesis C-methylase UbiE